MKNNIIQFLILALVVVSVQSCQKSTEGDSKAAAVVLPFLHEKRMQDSYIYGLGNATLVQDLPAVVAVLVDTVYGMEGGRGGRTGSDTLEIKKENWEAAPNLTKVGGSSINYCAFNKGGYKVCVGSNIVVAGPIADPGPTALEGTYKRTSNGYLLEVKKVFDGVYVLGNPGGAASVAYNPYLMYNHKSATGGDELRFPVQTDLCHGGLRLVSPTAPVALTAAEYDAYPPIISSTAPLTFQWKVFEFSSASGSAVHPDGALCNWGHTAVRTFVKQ